MNESLPLRRCKLNGKLFKVSQLFSLDFNWILTGLSVQHTFDFIFSTKCVDQQETPVNGETQTEGIDGIK